VLLGWISGGGGVGGLGGEKGVGGGLFGWGSCEEGLVGLSLFFFLNFLKSKNNNHIKIYRSQNRTRNRTTEKPLMKKPCTANQMENFFQHATIHPLYANVLSTYMPQKK